MGENGFKFKIFHRAFMTKCSCILNTIHLNEYLMMHVQWFSPVFDRISWSSRELILPIWKILTAQDKSVFHTDDQILVSISSKFSNFRNFHNSNFFRVAVLLSKMPRKVHQVWLYLCCLLRILKLSRHDLCRLRLMPRKS